MTILAITTENYEYLYSTRTAHKVNAKKARRIADTLNAKRYHLRDAAHKWHIYEIDQYDDAYIWASDQCFELGKRGLIRRGYDFPTL